MKIKLVKGFPAVFIKKLNALVIADLHIGIETEEKYRKFSLLIFNSVMKKLEELINTIEPEVLIINGDLKHQIFGKEFYLKKKLKKVLSTFPKNTIVVKGNHDGNLERILKEIEIFPKDMLLGKYYFTHGHANPSPISLKAKVWIIGHIHPGIKSKHFSESVFVITQVKRDFLKEKFGKSRKIKLYVLPAFNKFSGIYTLNAKKTDRRYKSPLWKDKVIERDKTEIYLLDGTYLGCLSDFS